MPCLWSLLPNYYLFYQFFVPNLYCFYNLHVYEITFVFWSPPCNHNNLLLSIHSFFPRKCKPLFSLRRLLLVFYSYIQKPFTIIDLIQGSLQFSNNTIISLCCHLPILLLPCLLLLEFDEIGWEHILIGRYIVIFYFVDLFHGIKLSLLTFLDMIFFVWISKCFEVSHRILYCPLGTHYISTFLFIINAKVNVRL